jgi:tRNA uridine 5-carboxymethylaminomethyl modification enzyme
MLILDKNSFLGLVSQFPEEISWIPKNTAETLRIEALYGKHLERQRTEVEAFKRDEDLRIPDDLDYSALVSLPTEEKEILIKHKPQTLGQASRIPGMTPASLFMIQALVRRRKQSRGTVRPPQVAAQQQQRAASTDATK